MPTQSGYIGPDFLCIGAPKSGSTWLYELLRVHPDVFLPKEIKEIRFFTRYYSRGVDWYKSLYSDQADHQISGDITPHYLYVNSVENIEKYNPSFKLILIYRDPVERCVSHFKFRRRSDNYQKTFADFINDYPESVEWGFYAKHLQKYIEAFPLDQFLFLKFEDVTKDVEAAKCQLAEFLGVAPSLFPTEAGHQRVNAHKEPLFPVAYKIGARMSRILVDLKLYKVRKAVKFLAKGLLRGRTSAKSEKPTSVISSEQLDELRQLYSEDYASLQQIVKSRSSKNYSF